MRSILSKAQLRRLEIVEFLYLKEEWTSLEELSSYFNSSDRVIKADLANLKSLSATSSIETNVIDFEYSEKGIKLVLDKHIGIDFIYHHIFSETVAFQILDGILRNENFSAEELSAQFFISPSTLYRIVNELNEVLKKRFNIEIKSNPYHMSGNEADIRSFYTQFYSEMEPGFGWPFTDIVDEHSLDEFIYYFADVVKIELQHIRYKLGKIAIAINIIRCRNKHFIENPLVDKHLLKLAEYYASEPTLLDKMAYFQKTLNLYSNFYTLYNTNFCIFLCRIN